MSDSENAKSAPVKIRLIQEKDGVKALVGEEHDAEEAVLVRLVYARPISAREREISVMDIKGRKELAWLSSLDELDAASRSIAEEALWKSYRIARVRRVQSSQVNHGHRYLRVETDRGERYFNLREPGTNVVRLSPDHLVIRDSMGNRYEIESVQRLDLESQEHLDRVL